MKAAEEMRQLKFMEPSDDRNPTQRKDAGNKQKLAINIVLEKKKKKKCQTCIQNCPQKKHACISTWTCRCKVNSRVDQSVGASAKYSINPAL